jgi:hypothetical protein
MLLNARGQSEKSTSWITLLPSRKGKTWEPVKDQWLSWTWGKREWNDGKKTTAMVVKLFHMILKLVICDIIHWLVRNHKTVQYKDCQKMHNGNEQTLFQKLHEKNLQHLQIWGKCKCSLNWESISNQSHWLSLRK